MTQEFHWESCCDCHIRFAFPKSLYQQAQEQRPKKALYCPAGHQFHYVGESDVDRERRLRQRAEQENARLAGEAAPAERERVRVQKELTRHQKRAANGACPCCKRSFANMARHMKSKHPDFGQVVPLKAAQA